MTVITTPGVYAMASEVYHADPALGSTGARKLIQECPAAYRFGIDEPKTEFDIGNATHLLVLEPDEFKRRVAVVIGKTAKGEVSYDWTTDDAKRQREAARDEGKIPLLMNQYDDVIAMRDAIMRDPVGGLAFRGGKPEQSMFWRDTEFGIMCKTRPDWVPAHGRYLVDIKTSTSADPRKFARAVVDWGYHQQAAWYLDGVEATTGRRPDRFAFVVVSKKAPYLVSTCWLDDEAIGWGRILNRRARGLFAWCMERDRWPSFQPDQTGAPSAFTISLPHWAKTDLEIRHQAGEFEPPQQTEIAA